MKKIKKQLFCFITACAMLASSTFVSAAELSEAKSTVRVNGETVPSLQEGIISADATINVDEAKTVMVFGVVYADGKVENIVCEDQKLTQGINTVSVTGLDVTSNSDKFRIMVWEKANFAPVISVPVFTDGSNLPLITGFSLPIANIEKAGETTYYGEIDEKNKTITLPVPAYTAQSNNASEPAARRTTSPTSYSEAVSSAAPQITLAEGTVLVDDATNLNLMDGASITVQNTAGETATYQVKAVATSMQRATNFKNSSMHLVNNSADANYYKTAKRRGTPQGGLGGSGTWFMDHFTFEGEPSFATQPYLCSKDDRTTETPGYLNVEVGEGVHIVKDRTNDVFDLYSNGGGALSSLLKKIVVKTQMTVDSLTGGAFTIEAGLYGANVELRPAENNNIDVYFGISGNMHNTGIVLTKETSYTIQASVEDFETFKRGILTVNGKTFSMDWKKTKDISLSTKHVRYLFDQEATGDIMLENWETDYLIKELEKPEISSFAVALKGLSMTGGDKTYTFNGIVDDSTDTIDVVIPVRYDSNSALASITKIKNNAWYLRLADTELTDEEFETALQSITPKVTVPAGTTLVTTITDMDLSDGGEIVVKNAANEERTYTVNIHGTTLQKDMNFANATEITSPASQYGYATKGRLGALTSAGTVAGNGTWYIDGFEWKNNGEYYTDASGDQIVEIGAKDSDTSHRYAYADGAVNSPYVPSSNSAGYLAMKQTGAGGDTGVKIVKNNQGAMKLYHTGAVSPISNVGMSDSFVSFEIEDISGNDGALISFGENGMGIKMIPNSSNKYDLYFGFEGQMVDTNIDLNKNQKYEAECLMVKQDNDVWHGVLKIDGEIAYTVLQTATKVYSLNAAQISFEPADTTTCSLNLYRWYMTYEKLDVPTEIMTMYNNIQADEQEIVRFETTLYDGNSWNNDENYGHGMFYSPSSKLFAEQFAESNLTAAKQKLQFAAEIESTSQYLSMLNNVGIIKYMPTNIKEGFENFFNSRYNSEDELYYDPLYTEFVNDRGTSRNTTNSISALNDLTKATSPITISNLNLAAAAYASAPPINEDLMQEIELQSEEMLNEIDEETMKQSEAAAYASAPVMLSLAANGAENVNGIESLVAYYNEQEAGYGTALSAVTSESQLQDADFAVAPAEYDGCTISDIEDDVYETPGTFLLWLKGLNWRGHSWGAGDKLSNAPTYIEKLDPAVQAEYWKVALRFLVLNQDQELGTWIGYKASNKTWQQQYGIEVSGVFKVILFLAKVPDEIMDEYEFWTDRGLSSKVYIPNAKNLYDNFIKPYYLDTNTMLDATLQVRNTLDVINYIRFQDDDLAFELEHDILSILNKAYNEMAAYKYASTNTLSGMNEYVSSKDGDRMYSSDSTGMGNYQSLGLNEGCINTAASITKIYTLISNFYDVARPKYGEDFAREIYTMIQGELENHTWLRNYQNKGIFENFEAQTEGSKFAAPYSNVTVSAGVSKGSANVVSGTQLNGQTGQFLDLYYAGTTESTTTATYATWKNSSMTSIGTGKTATVTFDIKIDSQYNKNDGVLGYFGLNSTAIFNLVRKSDGTYTIKSKINSGGTGSELISGMQVGRWYTIKMTYDPDANKPTKISLYDSVSGDVVEYTTSHYWGSDVTGAIAPLSPKQFEVRFQRNANSGELGHIYLDNIKYIIG